MGKNKNTKKEAVMAPVPSSNLSSTGKTLAWVGGILVVTGFFVLFFADPMGKNWAAQSSPFLLIAGYASIGVGLFLPPDPSGAAAKPK